MSCWIVPTNSREFLWMYPKLNSLGCDTTTSGREDRMRTKWLIALFVLLVVTALQWVFDFRPVETNGLAQAGAATPQRRQGGGQQEPGAPNLGARGFGEHENPP